jgi:hypothetical protein
MKELYYANNSGLPALETAPELFSHAPGILLTIHSPNPLSQIAPAPAIWHLGFLISDML